MTNPKATESTTPETSATSNSRSYGDPVIVDDGGSTRIGQRGKQFINNFADGAFGDGSLLFIYSVAADSTETLSRDEIGPDAEVTIESGPSGDATEVKLAISTANQLAVTLPKRATHHINQGHHNYHVASAAKITKVSLRQGTGAPKVVFDAAASLALFTVVSVVGAS